MKKVKHEWNNVNDLDENENLKDENGRNKINGYIVVEMAKYFIKKNTNPQKVKCLYFAHNGHVGRNLLRIFLR